MWNRSSHLTRSRSVIAQTPALILAGAALFLSLGGAAYASSAAPHSIAPKTSVAFHALTLKGGWASSNTSYGTGNPSVGILNGVVYLSGSMHQAVIESSTFATLPPAYRPSHNLYLVTYTNGDTTGTLFIGKNGSMEAYSATACGGGNTANCFTSLAGINFPKNS